MSYKVKFFLLAMTTIACVSMQASHIATDIKPEGCRLYDDFILRENCIPTITLTPVSESKKNNKCGRSIIGGRSTQRTDTFLNPLRPHDSRLRKRMNVHDTVTLIELELIRKFQLA